MYTVSIEYVRYFLGYNLEILAHPQTKHIFEPKGWGKSFISLGNSLLNVVFCKSISFTWLRPLNKIVYKINLFLTCLSHNIKFYVVGTVRYCREMQKGPGSMPLYGGGPPPAAPPSYSESVRGVTPTSPFTPGQPGE